MSGLRSPTLALRCSVWRTIERARGHVSVRGTSLNLKSEEVPAALSTARLVDDFVVCLAVDFGADQRYGCNHDFKNWLATPVLGRVFAWPNLLRHHRRHRAGSFWRDRGGRPRAEHPPRHPGSGSWNCKKAPGRLRRPPAAPQ